ncbi:hypothetical protein [Vibrio sp. FJH11]
MNLEPLIEELKSIAEEFPLKEYFTWMMPEDCPLDFPSEITSNYDRNLFMKHNLSSLLVNDLTNRYWVIQTWGGIGSLKSTEKNDDILLKLDARLSKGALDKKTFDVISSMSKVASFLDHTKYAIYDSRVIYSLNWLLLKHTDTNEFYPMPSGRNKDLIKLDLDTIINLTGRDSDKISYKDAYHRYCDLMIELSKAIYERHEPYWSEMLLFSIAPKYVTGDIKQSISISIND